MATTIVNATFTSTVTDSITLNGKTYGNTSTKAVGSCNEAYERILSIPAASGSQEFIHILGVTAEPDGAGDVTFSEFEYARFTNLDTEYPIWLKFANIATLDTNPSSATEAFCIKLDPGMSYICPSGQWIATDDDILVANIVTHGGKDGDKLPAAFVVSAVAHTAVCDLEMFVVTK